MFTKEKINRCFLMKMNPNIPAVLFLFFAWMVYPVFAQAPVNDVVSWPSGLLLLATVLYAALGTAPDILWRVDPCTGVFFGTGLPLICPIPSMRRGNWVSDRCHFVAGIRTSFGKSNFWVRSEHVSPSTRSQALQNTLQVIHPIVHQPPMKSFNNQLWTVTPLGLSQSPSSSHPQTTPQNQSPTTTPSARDFLLFAAIHYHVFWYWEVKVMNKGTLLHSSTGSGEAVFDIEDEDAALAATHMVRRPHTQTTIRRYAKRTCSRANKNSDDDFCPYVLDLSHVPQKQLACAIDFHSYARPASKVSASLREMAGAYYRVVQYIKQCHLSCDPGNMVRCSVGQSLWIAILGGELLDKGRLTIQNLPGRWSCFGVTANEAYLSRIDKVLEELKPHVNRSAFDDLAFSNGIARHLAFPFLIIGILGQIAICYFLAVGTSAGIWTSVALANCLYNGRPTDIHSMYYGKTTDDDEPGMKIYVPGSQSLMVIATLDRTTPRQGALQPGLLLNIFGLVAAIFGSIFRTQTRVALGFSQFHPSPKWVVYAAVGASLIVSLFLLYLAIEVHCRERLWFSDVETPMRWMIQTTVSCSFLVSGLAIFFIVTNRQKYWPVLDALTWISGIPLGMLENGRMPACDRNNLQLVLVNRWLIGAVASALGSLG
ncbi:hypothetical protein K435DRAFT_720995 [Dendrothele bispora CBS 962.96]|uniref:Uncharacterized protein n=1 Tax=Dendrothele bispora (strain CBS 962.96) TaxID=1314807 RepID=A0A4S8M8M0_DENBC|nr:hypothetical protein K435DRAFT_720995 [Dendrothele bispora CBS 962.96]